jgi:hypothetical protein
VAAAGLRSRSLSEAELLVDLVRGQDAALADAAAEALVAVTRRVDHLSIDQAGDADEDGPGAVRALAQQIFEAAQAPGLPAPRRALLLEAHDELATAAGTPSLIARSAQLRFQR